MRLGPPGRGDRAGRDARSGAEGRTTRRSRSAPADAVILATPAWITPGLLPGVDRARRVPRHRQRPLQGRAAGRRAEDGRGDRRRRRSGCSPSTDRISVTVSGADAMVDTAARGDRRARSGPTSPRSTGSPASCRPGRSSRSGAPPSPRRPSRSPSGPPAAHALAQPCAGRRLDRYRPARHHRGRDPLGPQGGRDHPGAEDARHGRRERNPERDLGPDDARQASTTSTRAVAARRRRAAEAAAPGRPLGVRAGGRRHHPGRIRAASSTTSARRRTWSWSARSASTCAASRASTAAGRSITAASSTCRRR